MRNASGTEDFPDLTPSRFAEVQEGQPSGRFPGGNLSHDQPLRVQGKETHRAAVGTVPGGLSGWQSVFVRAAGRVVVLT